MTARSAAIAAAYMLAVSQGGAMLRNGKTYGPANHLPPRHASHDAECIAKAEAKRARKAAKRVKRAKLLERETCAVICAAAIRGRGDQ